MGRNHSLQLSIPQPCSENWDNMPPNERGRHCSNCNKTVIDFSLFTDKQLIDFFHKTKENICGRFTSFQLQRQMVYVEPQHHFLSKVLLGTALTLGFVGSANGNYNPNQKPLVEQYMGIDNYKSQESLPHDTSKHISITVVDDSTGKALPFLTVELFKDNSLIMDSYTDTSGIAELSVNTYGNYIIKSEYPGYDKNIQTITIDRNYQKMTIRLNFNSKALDSIPVKAINITFGKPRIVIDSTIKSDNTGHK